MNFLAHARLSFDHPEVTVGNMISDFVKGKKRYDYPPLVQAGIELHRRIDAFTDNHEATHKGKEIFRKDYRLYAGAIMDIVYDHYLANDIQEFGVKPLAQFADEVYNVLNDRKHVLPEKFGGMLPFMIRDNWLLNYKEQWGIERSMKGLVYRATYLTDHQPAFNSFNAQYLYLQECYDLFWKDVKAFAKTEFTQLVL